MIRLYPDLSIEDAAHGARAEPVRELIWTVAADALGLGLGIVLERNFWSVQRHCWATPNAQESGAEVELHRLVTGPDEATARARRRSTGGDGLRPPDLPADDHLAAIVEPRPSSRAS